MTEKELIAEFSEDGWYELEDEVYRRHSFTPMKVEIEEHHVGVHNSKKDNHFKKADYLAYLLRNSLVSPSLLAGVWNAKYVNATPLYRQEQGFQRMGHNIDRSDMIDIVAEAEASALVYSIAKIAKANNLKPYNYFKYLLEGIPRHMDEYGVDFCEDLLPWLAKLPAECRK